MEILLKKQNGVVRILEWFGEFGLFCGRALRAAGITSRYQIKELIRQMDEVGSKSIALVILTGAALGVVISIHLRDSLVRFGAESALPAVIVLSIIKESGPIITALVVSGRVAAGIGAELGSMKVTEQIDALEASAIDPYRLLVVPRVLACIFMLPLLTIVTDFFGILMGWVSNAVIEPISLRLFLNEGLKSVTFADLIPSTLRTTIFGFIIGMISCFEGMRTEGGTEGVGRSTKTAVVLSALFVILADVFLVKLILILFE
jgi:phospholipid/cholesterol/gamma-HCH transport system permease protein